MTDVLYSLQNKKRKYNRDEEEQIGREKTPEEPEDPLKDATTLYVGNLSVCIYLNPRAIQNAYVKQIFLHDRGANT